MKSQTIRKYPAYFIRLIMSISYVCIGLTQIVHIVGADERHLQIARNRRQPAVHDALLVDTVPLHLEIEVSWPQDVAIRSRGLTRFILLLPGETFSHFPFETAAQP